MGNKKVLEPSFVQTVRERKTGVKNITIPKPVSGKYDSGKQYFIYITEEKIVLGDNIEE